MDDLTEPQPSSLKLRFKSFIFAYSKAPELAPWRSPGQTDKRTNGQTDKRTNGQKEKTGLNQRARKFGCFYAMLPALHAADPNPFGSQPQL